MGSYTVGGCAFLLIGLVIIGWIGLWALGLVYALVWPQRFGG